VTEKCTMFDDQTQAKLENCHGTSAPRNISGKLIQTRDRKARKYKGGKPRVTESSKKWVVKKAGGSRTLERLEEAMEERFHKIGEREREKSRVL